MEKLQNNSENVPRTDEELLEFIVSSLEKLTYTLDKNERALISLDIKDAVDEFDLRFPMAEQSNE